MFGLRSNSRRVVKFGRLRTGLLATFAFMALSFLVGTKANAQWREAIKLSPDDGSASLNENMGRCLIADGDSVHVVWADHKKARQAIFHRHSKDRGESWERETQLTDAAGVNAFPLLAQSGANLHLVFLRNFGTPQAASYYKHSPDGGKTWEPEFLLGKSKWWPGVAAAGEMVYVSLNTVNADEPANSIVYFRRSKDNGATWDERQPISSAEPRKGGRSEDPAIVAAGDSVHLVWNDNRDAAAGKNMSVYYRRSSDRGATWDAEVALTRSPSYTYFPTISLSGNHAAIAYGDRQSGHYNIFFQQSADSGKTWEPKQQVSKSDAGDFYPAVATDGTQVHLAWMNKQGIMYLHSADGGAHWEPAVCVAEKGSSPFIATAGDCVHLIYVLRSGGQGTIQYLRNPTGNKPTATATP